MLTLRTQVCRWKWDETKETRKENRKIPQEKTNKQLCCVHRKWN